MALKVIGAGLPRTGTSSLKLALEQLGFGPCYHMREVIEHPEFAAHWERAADGAHVDWDEVFQGYHATTDAPACHFYKSLAEHYPDAKVLLSMRDPEAWFASTQNTILRPEVMAMHEARGTLTMCNKIGWGIDPRLREHAYMVERFYRHNDAVKKTIPAERLLVFDVREGWEPLCRFLGVPVPETPFPRTNSTEEFGQMINARAAGQA
jgi:hypothetical protein